MSPTGPLAVVLNVLWLVVTGFWMAVGYIASLELVPISLLPLGREVVPADRPLTATTLVRT